MKNISASKSRLSPDEQLEVLSLAAKRAASRDSRGMIEALYASGFLAGLKRRLQNKWRRLPASDVDDCVAEAVNAAFTAVASGRVVRNLGGWLWKAADNIANSRWNDDHVCRRPADNLEAQPRITGEEFFEREEKMVKRREEVIRLARSLLPQVGHGQIRDVMDLVIEAVDNGEPDLPAELIADTLGITANAARSLLSRGLERLRRAAENAGIEISFYCPAEESGDAHDEDNSQ